MRLIEWDCLTQEERIIALARPHIHQDKALMDTVTDIFQRLEKNGPSALIDIALKLDGAAPRRLELTAAMVCEAREQLDKKDLEALSVAKTNILTFHQASYPKDSLVEMAPGVRCRRLFRPIDCVGIYVPGGTAPLVSSLMMLALPALAAGVDKIVAATPPNKDKSVHPAMIVAADLCGLDDLYVVGGAQAIAAMTMGIAPLPRVAKIFGPGNAYVAAAKRYASGLSGGPAIDLPAGPSELLIIADEFADVGLVAADLLGQAEHDPAAQVLLVTDTPDIARMLETVIEKQLPALSRSTIARLSLANGRIISVSDLDQAIDVANQYAPEHLSLHLRNADDYVDRIMNAGAVFVGAWAGETFGDYICGPSHVLPTGGAARAWGGVSTESFMRSMIVQEISKGGAKLLSDPAIRLARLEGLDAHAATIERRKTMMAKGECGV